MVREMDELKNQIVQKNLILAEMCKSGCSCSENICVVQEELDQLLYRYYKLIRNA